MAFKTIKRLRAGRPQLKNVVRFSKPTKSIVQIRISEDILKSMGSPSYVLVAVGDGPDTGRILLQKVSNDTDFAYKLSRPKQAICRQIAVSPMKIGLGDSPLFKTTDAKHTVIDGNLIIQIPNINAFAVAAE